MKTRVLILSASGGEGHVRAGQALEKAFAARDDCLVEHIDALEYTSKLFQKIYDDAYIALARRAPQVVGWVYERLDQPWRHHARRSTFQRLNTRPMMRLVKRVQPDLCLATHFLPAGVIAWLKEGDKIHARLAVAITDFDVHAMWLCRNVDRFYVAQEESAEYLRVLGVPQAAVRVSGIPIDPVFAGPKNSRSIRARLGLDPARKTLLVAAGGHAIGPIEKLVSDLLELDPSLQIVVVTGRAAQVRTRLEKLAASVAESDGRHTRLRVLGFTEQMHDWMAAADLLAGKAGGLTISEALASSLPMAVVGLLAGPQEDRNADMLLERGAAIRCHNVLTAAWKISGLLGDSERLAGMRAAAKASARPRAALEIAEDAIKMVRRGERASEQVLATD